MLFKETSEIKLHIAINKNMAFNTLSPYIEQAETTYIIPLISQELYDELDEAYNGEDDLSEEQEKLLKKIQRPLAYYSLAEAAPFLNLSISDLGLQQEQDKDGMSTPVAQWRYENYIKSLWDNADRFADKLLEFLEKNKDDYEEWAESDAYTITKELFINSAAELSKFININNSRRAYLAIRPFIAIAEQKYFIASISQELFDEIKEEIKSDDLSDENKTLLEKIKTPLAHFALFEAIPQISISIESKGFKINSSTDGFNSNDKAEMKMIEDLKQSSINLANQFMSIMKKYLDDNADDYPLYKDSDNYNDEQPRTQLPNNIDKPDVWV